MTQHLRSLIDMEMFQSLFCSREVMERVINARQFMKDRPKTCLFAGVLFSCAFVPVAIFLAFILGVFFFLLTCMLVIQGTVIGFSLTALLVFLPGPLCFASFCTLVAYVIQRAWIHLQPVCKTALGMALSYIALLLPSIPDPIMSLMNAYQECRPANGDISYDTEESLSADDTFGHSFNVPNKDVWNSGGQNILTVKQYFQHDVTKGLAYRWVNQSTRNFYLGTECRVYGTDCHVY